MADNILWTRSPGHTLIPEETVTYATADSATAEILAGLAFAEGKWYMTQPHRDGTHTVTTVAMEGYDLGDLYAKHIAPVKNKEGKTILFVTQDIGAENPLSWEEHVSVYSFSHRDSNFKHPDTFGLNFEMVGGVRTIATSDDALQGKLAGGGAFILSCFKHGPGTTQWSVYKGGDYEFDFDTATFAGLLIFEDGHGIPDPHKAADSIMKSYSEWCRGEVYYVELRDSDGESIDSICGVYPGNIESSAVDNFDSVEEGNTVIFYEY